MKDLDEQDLELFLIDLNEARLTLMKLKVGRLSLYTTKEHLRIDLEKIIVWMEDY